MLNIAIVAGGDSGEYEISIKSARQVEMNLDRTRFVPYLIEIRKDKWIHRTGGDIIEIDSNKKVGKHNGYYFYTIGQRSGLKLSGGPWFVVSKDVHQNIIYISRENKSLREKNEFNAGKFNWISGSKPENEKFEVKIRHGAKKFLCEIRFNDSDLALVKMNEADQGIAPGQFAVFYDEDLCLGSGVIL